MIHKEITDKQWKSIIPHLSKPAKTGRPRADDRTTINGILFVLTVGCRWEELPEKYGSKSTAHLRLQDWQQKGVWKKIFVPRIFLNPSYPVTLPLFYCE